MLLALPSVASLAVEPLLGLVAVTWRRRALVLGGGLAFAGALALAAVARSEWMLLAAFAVLYPASGAFVSLSQASLMDLDPERREHNMARWTVAGSIGAIAGPLLLAAAAWAGLGWRGLFAAFAVLTLGLLLRPAPAAPRRRAAAHPRGAARDHAARGAALAAAARAGRPAARRLRRLPRPLPRGRGRRVTRRGRARRRRVGRRRARGLGGDDPAAATDRRPALPARERGRRRVLFAAFLVVPGIGAKLVLLAALAVVNAGWYPVLQARLYDALGGASGLVLTASTLVPLWAVLPVAIAAVADRWGLAARCGRCSPRRSRCSRWCPGARVRMSRAARPKRPRTPALIGRGRPLRPLRSTLPAAPKNFASALQQLCANFCNNRARTSPRGQLPDQRGSRFSRNAATPSRPSPDWRQRVNASSSRS